MKAFQEMDSYEKIEFLSPLVKKLNITVDKAIEILSDALTQVEIDAETAQSDESINDPEMILLKIFIEQKCNLKITAIKIQKSNKITHIFPDNFMPGCDYYEKLREYSYRRFGLVPSTLTEKEKAWRVIKYNTPCITFITSGNPIMIESALIEIGYTDASALSGTTCSVKFLD